MATYSFLDVNGAIVGPGGNFQLGSGSAAAKEGITVSMVEDKNTMTIGADGSGMNALNASKAGKITVRLLKTSPVNKQLSSMYNLQSISSSAWGLNTISIKNPISGDSITATQCSFTKFPDVVYDVAGPMNVWEFDAVKVDTTLGGGLLENLATFGVDAV